ncbi:MAG TPA: hypothetical protein VN960_06255 [Gaiellaceae bacterium]|nr:hypothetical protein [Gaiellaceae bacterium]
MKRLVLTTAFVVAIAMAASSTAAPSPDATKNANSACTALRAKIGPTVFGQAYATFGRCVSALAQVEQQNLTSAQSACTAEQSDPTFAAIHGGKTFDQFYGSGPKGKNAFGNCVSAKARASSRAEGQDRPNPARTCRAARTASPEAFKLLYGNSANAFGKCVSKAAKAQTQNELNAAQTCRAEQSDATFVADHGGKTFAQFYGTNADMSNAFGKCVSTKASEKTQSQQQATVAAAKACLSERNADQPAFRTKYGTFGHCVSLKARGK